MEQPTLPSPPVPPVDFASVEPRTSDPTAVAMVVSRLRRRALTVRIVSGVTLAIVFALIGAAILLLIYFEGAVGELENTDMTSLKSRIETIGETAERISTTLHQRRGKVGNDQEENLRVAELRATKLRDELAAVDPDNLRTRFFISLLATRITIVLILIFMANFSISAFRYFSRLGAFFDSRADLLMLLGDVSGVNAEQLSAILAADRLDFRSVKSPDQQAIDLARPLLARFNSEKEAAKRSR